MIRFEGHTCSGNQPTGFCQITLQKWHNHKHV